MSLDQEKAYDRVRHSYIFAALEAFGFPLQVINLVKGLYTNIESELVVDGKIVTKTEISQGVRQGCPLSPVLFVLSLEPFLQQVRRDTLIRGLPLPGSASAVVNAYADDITVYVQDCDSLRRVWRIFDAYAAISGAALNFNKCHGISLGQLALWPSEITRKPTVKILGVWFNANGASRKTWSNIYHAMEAEVEKLERFQVPLFERRHFAHSVLCGPAWYVARTIPPPRKTALRLQRLLTEFFWNHKTALVAAPVLSLARDQGGVSYPRIRTQARVLAVKGVLQILDDEESPARPLARYFLGTARRSLCRNDRDNCSPSATKPTKFYKDIITMHRLISEQAPEVEVRNVPATRVAEILTCQEIAPNRQASINAFHWTALTAATIPVDVREFEWKRGWNVLRTNTQTYRWGARGSPSPLCINCGQMETTTHVVAECVVAQQLWARLTRGFGLDIRKYVTQNSPPKKPWARLVVTVGEWALWKNRCQASVQQRRQRAMWPILLRMRRKLRSFLEEEFAVQNREIFERRWCSRLVRVVDDRLHCLFPPLEWV